MSDPPDLETCESIVDDEGEQQLRQVHPHFVDGDVVSREAFVGTPGATDEVSTARRAIVTPEGAYRFHSETLGLETSGTWAVSVGEVKAADCRVVDDAECDGVEAPGHSFIDMRGLSKSARRQARTELASAATQRGRLYP